MNNIKINAKLSSYSKGIFPSFPSPSISDYGKVIGVNQLGEYSLVDQNITPEQLQEIVNKLNTIESGAQVNKIESVSINGQDLPIVGKKANIPLASNNSPGVVKGSNDENSVSVLSNGTLIVNDINIDKIIQNDGQTIILYNGSSTIE